MTISRKTKKLIFLTLGFVSIILGFIGLFLPILPTTPFLILAAYLFSQSSKRMHNWLLEHRIFGPIINDWEKHGAISVKTKWIACTAIVIFFSYTLIFVNVNIYIKSIVALSGIVVMAFILSRPSR
ncbi:YbaN family protein [Bacteriovorax sp. Seq25_V]|uniref:YbaN family protein n=1 Tax=Bacteriovorax sp. Seq25_V TaxID=1201288 RepID=UPI000389E23F|nr:YbaN family protein [Bacteriovorax sp. Seq25_V]EQC45280.1 PF04304 family protein [Bacteriovorax sp. Seq25_V]